MPPGSKREPNAPADAAARWDTTYRTRGVAGVSWYQTEPAVSLELIEATGLEQEGAIIDVGGGASVLVDKLIGRGFTDVTVLDISAVALAEARSQLGTSDTVTWIQRDLLAFEPARLYDLWHDRAVFHFLVDEADRATYRDVLLSSLAPAGFVVIGTFAEDGPTRCSGLPVTRYSGQGLGDALGSSFRVRESRRELHSTPSGGTQAFNWVSAQRVI